MRELALILVPLAAAVATFVWRSERTRCWLLPVVGVIHSVIALMLFVDPPPADQELSPGDRVEGRGDFGKLTGEFGTVERTNEEDAIVKWDDDGRKRLHQPWLKKI